MVNNSTRRRGRQAVASSSSNLFFNYFLCSNLEVILGEVSNFD